MSYCSIDEVVHEFTLPLLNSMKRDYGDDFDNIIAGHIQKAHDFVNSSLARTYTVPLSSPTSIVITAECKLAAFYAVAAYSEKEEVLRDKYETAILMLDNLVQADNSALVDLDAVDDDSNNSGVLYGSNNKIFSDYELQNW